MAILWPTGTQEEARAGEVLRRALGATVTLVGGGAGVLALKDTGSTEESASGVVQRDGQISVLAVGIRLEAALSLVNRLASDAVPLPMDGRPRVSVLPEYWGGEIATLALADMGGAIGEVHLLGPRGFSGYRPLADVRRRQASLSELATVIRLHQERSRLQQENRQLSSILHFSGDGIITVDPTLRITGFNQAMETMTTWHPHEVMGRFYYDVLRPRNPQGNSLGPDRDPLMLAISSGRTVLNRELILLTRDGQPVNVSVTAAAIQASQGQPISGVLNVRDITRTREAEELRTTFVSVVSHELQTPIAIIKGYASTLAREDAHWDAEALRERLHAIEEEADRLNHLVGNVLYASRIQAGGLTMERGELDLAEMARSVVRRFHARSPDRKISTRFPAATPLVYADRGRIEEVLLNLLDNAVKYSPRGQDIRVRGQVTDDEVTVSVTDVGQGIPLREQERIFERFQ
ncbi:MAG TPA: histidine kinase dimerization/phospho-acceptor domain-containing protein, partial [Ktedonobacterales bacterium]|nr:histidine kinase dimerization/phospho-acceptor domain-containing protein [Ktedonobacterales bacterium]